MFKQKHIAPKKNNNNNNNNNNNSNNNNNNISNMHYNYDTTMQATLFIYRSDPTMQRHLYKGKPQLGPSRAKVNAIRSRQL